MLTAALAAAALAIGVPAQASPSLGPRHLFKDYACNLIRPARTSAPYSQGKCPGVRPGAIVLIGGRGQCTMNFVFKGANGATYIGTAGHCVLPPAGGEKTWTDLRGPSAQNSYGQWIGNFAYAVLNDTKDFTLIRIRPGVKANPKMCHFGGPDGMYQKHQPTPTTLKYFGNSPMYRDSLPARTAVTPAVDDPDLVIAAGFAWHGDSGSGVLNQAGEAIGVLVAGGLVLGGQEFAAPDMLLTRLDSQIARAQKKLKIRMTLRTAEVSPDLSL